MTEQPPKQLQRWQQRANRLQQRVGRWWQRQPNETRALPSYLLQAVNNFNNYGARQAAALAFYAIFSIFPLLLLLTVVLNSVVGPIVTQDQILSIISAFLPSASADVLQLAADNVAQALKQGQSFGLIAIVSLAWSGLGLFSGITLAIDATFQVTINRSLLRQRLIALIMALVLLSLVAGSFLISAALRLANAVLLSERPSVWLWVGANFLPLGLNLIIFALLFRFVPARRVAWDAIWPAAIIGALGWELAKLGFNWYLNNLADYQFVYGTLSTGIVLLFWAYLIASIFVLSAEICARLNEWLHDTGQHRPPTQPVPFPLPHDDDG